MNRSIAATALICYLLISPPGDSSGAAPSNLPLVQPDSLEYIGAFRVPATSNNGTSFNYGGNAIGYNRKRNSLYVVGHDWEQMVAEISIPRVVKSNSLGDLERASFLQNFADISDGKMQSVDDGSIVVGGLHVKGSQLYGTAYSYYDADGNQTLSHFISPLDISGSNDANGMFRVGKLGAGFVSGWMADVPSAWKGRVGAPMLTGNCCIPIISRTSYGPAAFGFNPGHLARKRPVPVKPLVYYPASHPTLGGWDSNSSHFNGTTQVAGVALSKGRRSLLFFGTHGTGDFCYGTGSECGDPVDEYKGTHGYPYTFQIWAYDMNELLRVKRGSMRPWQARPYRVWKFNLPFGGENKSLGGVAYSSKDNRIYVSQRFGDGDRPVIHAFRP